MKNIFTKTCLFIFTCTIMSSIAGCGQTQDAQETANNTDVSVSTAITKATTNSTTSVSTEITTTTAETTEEVTETTTVTEDEWLAEWKNSDSYITGISDLRENMDSLYAVHILVGGDAIKAYELGFDNVTSGYDLVWKFDDEEKYYMRDFANNQNRTIDPLYDCSLKAEFEEVGQDVYTDLAYNKTTNYLFMNSNKNNKYNPFINGDAEYKDNTLCIIWQKSEGTLDGAKAFYYSVNADDYNNVIEKAFENCDNADFDYYAHHEIKTIEDTNVFDITGTGSLNDEETEETSKTETTTE